MVRTPAVWPWALAVSLLLHGVLLLLVLRGEGPDVETPPPQWVEARLITPPPPSPPSVVAQPRPRPPMPRRAAPPPKAQADAADTPPAAGGAAGESEASGVEPAAAAAEASSAAGAELAAPTAAAEAPAGPPLNPLPPRIDLRFDVRYGFARGEQTLVWVSDGDTYTITSVAAATGFAGVFYSGRFVQTSQGRLTAQGLVPEMFWDQRGEKRSSARFDEANRLLVYNPARGAPRQYAYPEGAQDTLSLFFQLALTAPPAGVAAYTVFNGKKLRHYAYAVRGEVTLDTVLGPLRTLHLARTGSEDGRFELWLAVDWHYLPVRVLRTDDKGNEVELTLASISP